MIPEDLKPWQKNGAAAVARALDPRPFIKRHIAPLFFRHTIESPRVRHTKDIGSEKQFWKESGDILFGQVRLNRFKLIDWFPRTPGVFWSDRALLAREQAWSLQPKTSDRLGQYYSPETKEDLIENGGIGSIRLRPRKIDGELCWLGTALTGTECHSGIPLAIPDSVLFDSGVVWGDRVNLAGRVRFLPDAGLNDTTNEIHDARPLIVFVDELEGTASLRSSEPVIISPVALFISTIENPHYNYEEAQYTFGQCVVGKDSELDSTAAWIQDYAEAHRGKVITNFDEQRPALKDAPLSYQKLVNKTFSRSLITQHVGAIYVERLETLVHQESTTTQYLGETHVGHNISVGGNAIINIDATLNNVTQTIGAAGGLEPAQKTELERMVQALKTDLDAIKSTHPDETQAIADALQKATTQATKPQSERKPSMLELTAKGLKDAAETVKDIAPAVLTTAALIAKFVVDLH